MRMKLLLVDDHALLRDGLALLMAQEFAGLQVLQAGSVAEAHAALEAHGDVRLVLLDLGLPDGDGVEALPQLREAAPMALLVALSADERRETVLAAIAAGAAGYIPKSSQSGAMLRALRVVLAGGVYLPAAVLEQRASERPGAPAADIPQRCAEDLGLSPRQVDVLKLLVEGKSNKLIARDLAMSESTVKTHLEALFRRLSVNSRTQAVVAAARLGLRLNPL
jgi:DNA-binding NarL/FixJ family response regulator